MFNRSRLWWCTNTFYALSSSSTSFNPVFPRVRRWPDAPHFFSNRSHSLSPSRAICSFLHPQPNLLYILFDLFLPCLLRPSSLSWSIHFIGAGSRVPGGAQAPPELFLAPPEPFEPPLTIEKIMH